MLYHQELLLSMHNLDHPRGSNCGLDSAPGVTSEGGLANPRLQALSSRGAADGYSPRSVLSSTTNRIE